MNDETVGKVEDFMSEHYILFGSAAGAIIGGFTALLCMCTVYRNAYKVGLKDGLNVCNNMVKETVNMFKESK